MPPHVYSLRCVLICKDFARVSRLSNLYICHTRSEASALVGSECSAQQAALALGPHADMVVVTDGADGSCISALGSLQVRLVWHAAGTSMWSCAMHLRCTSADAVQCEAQDILIQSRGGVFQGKQGGIQCLSSVPGRAGCATVLGD
jgi:hypothetical protein